MEGELIRVKAALIVTLPPLSPVFVPATQARKDKEIEQLCVRIAWTNVQQRGKAGFWCRSVFTI